MELIFNATETVFSNYAIFIKVLKTTENNVFIDNDVSTTIRSEEVEFLSKKGLTTDIIQPTTLPILTTPLNTIATTFDFNDISD